MIIAWRLYRFHRRSGMPPLAAVRRAITTVWRDFRRPPFHWPPLA